MTSLLRNLIVRELLEEANRESEIERLLKNKNFKQWKHRSREDEFPHKDGVSPADNHRKIIKYLRSMSPSEKQRKLIPKIESALTLGQDDEVDFKNFLSPVVDNIWSTYKRIQIRKLWQLAVYSNDERASFWRDPENVKCIHGIGLFENLDSMELLEKTLTSPPVELSCVGSLEPFIPGDSIAIEFRKREIVWASESDSWTQHLSSANDQVRADFAKLKALEILTTPEEFQVFKSSLNKFPSSAYINEKDVLFTEEDFLRIADGFASEVIIRDYSTDPNDIIIYVSKSHGSDIKYIKEKIQKISFKHYNRPVTILEI